MKHRPPLLLLPERPVRWLGIGLLATGLALPPTVLVWRARDWEPPPPQQDEAPRLRPEMMELTPGTFLMGSPGDEEDRNADETLHEVEITRSFALSRTEVTQGQFFAVMGTRPAAREDCSRAGVGDDLPVVCVTWFEAVEYCNRLSAAEGLVDLAYDITGKDVTLRPGSTGYRLPTEAEWEYAARGGTRTRWVGTDDLAEVCDFANVADQTGKVKYTDWTVFPCDDGHAELAPVRRPTVRPNRWHLFGMGGNALEWVWDWHGEDREARSVDPAGHPRGSSRVLRGGSWISLPGGARVASRDTLEPSLRNVVVGFRVARSLPSVF